MVMTSMLSSEQSMTKLCFGVYENHQTQETSSLTRKVSDDKGEKTTRKTARAGSRGDAKFFY